MKVQVAGGEIVELGATETAPTIGIIDYSRRVTDDFGVTTVVERGFARRMSVRLKVAFDAVDALQRRLADLRATPALWIADDSLDSLAFQGFYKDFSIDLAVPPVSFCTLTIEGLTEPASFADPGGDPSADGQASTLRLIQPVAITDAVLVNSSVPETDYSAWAGGTTYAAGARVTRATTHRNYESLVAGNIGNDPAGASGKWSDIGPTNRWAMFDEALGSVTSGAGPLIVTLSASTANAVALLDVVGASVRVQTSGYDRTLAVGAGPVLFLDLPASHGNVMVTVSGSGQVQVGTLLIGRLVALGRTEAAPTAGITDYSRKEVDDFGAATIVERAWAKRMAVGALIRTDAVDLVAGRLATVRARPSLWIGDDGLDTLTIYGFFKDFSIEVGENVSKLSLSIEGLSKAAGTIEDPLAGAIADLAVLEAALNAAQDELTVQGALITAARDIALGKVAAFFQTTPPTVAESKEKDLWFDTGDGGIMYRRLPGNGRISYGGTVVTFGGSAIVHAPWAPAPDQRIAQALSQAAAAIAAAQAAQATADSAIDSIEALADDGLLTSVEKKQLILDDSRLQGAWSVLDAQAALFGITTERTAAANARSSWLALRNALAPAWNDVSADTAVDRSGFVAALSAYDAALSVLQKAISAKAATTADWDGVTGAGKATLLADAATAKANAAAALLQIGTIQSDGYLSAGEKPDIIRQRTTIDAEYGAIVAKAAAQGVTSTAYQAAYSALTSYLDALTPAYNNTALDTAIVPATFNGRFSDYYYARTELMAREADLTAANQLIVTLSSPGLEIPADYTGAIGAGTLPKTMLVTVRRGGVDVTVTNATSYSLTGFAGGCTSANVTVDNTNGSSSKGQVSVGTGWTANGSFTLFVSYDGGIVGSWVIPVTKKLGPPPSGGGSGSSGYVKTGNFSAAGKALASTSYVQVGIIPNMQKAAGESLYATFDGYYDVSGGSGANAAYAKWQYAPAGSGSWSDFPGGAATGGDATYIYNGTGGGGHTLPAPDDPPEWDISSGSVTCNRTAAPADGNYDIRLLAALVAGSPQLTFGGGTGAVEIRV